MASMLTKKEAASFLACSVDTIERLIALGVLPAIKLGPNGHVRIAHEDLVAFVAAQRSHRP